MKGSRVSVVVPAHNYAHTLGETLDSILAQTVPPFEILVVDDGSTDNTQEVIANYGDKIRSIRRQGRGAYGARNDSLKHISGDFFLNVDADNRIDPRYIEKTLNLLTASPPEIGYVYTQRLYMGERTGFSDFPDFDLNRLLMQNFVDMGSLIRMEHVKRFGFDERFNQGCGDHAFFLRLADEGIFGMRLNEPLLHYRIHGDSITRGVGKRYAQVGIQQMLIESFPRLYTPECAEKALAEAKNRTLVSLIHQRHPNARFSERWRDFRVFTRTNWRHGEWFKQLLYLLNPHWVS